MMKLRKRVLNRSQKRLWNIQMFLLRLVIFSIPLYLIVLLNVDLSPVQQVIAGQVEWLLNSSGLATQRQGLILVAGTENPFIFFIGPDCVGWKSMLFYAALVFAAIGVSMKKRAAGLAIGVPMIYLGNLGRILAVVFIERSYGTEAATLFHDWLWQAGLMAIVLITWLVWLRYSDIRKCLPRFSEGPGSIKPGTGKSRKRYKHIIGRVEK